MPMPTIEKKRFKFRYVIYILIAITCMIAIGISVYKQYFEEEKLGVVLNILFKRNKKENEEDLISLKENFTKFNIFTNSIYIIGNYNGDVAKIREEHDILFSEVINEQDKNYTTDIHIPYFNINSNAAKKINTEIKETFKDKYDSVVKNAGDKEIIYNVKYVAYLQNEIFSLVILSELKEEDSNQRIIIQTYNYNLITNSEVKIDELIEQKNIDVNLANDKIKEEIKSSQEENIKLSEMGYNINIRDYKSDMYKINNAEQFFLGEKGYLYIIYPYGNTEHTSELNLVILK